MSTETQNYPVQLTITPDETLARWRPTLQWLMAIPHLLLLAVLSIAAFACIIGVWLSAVFTGRAPEGMVRFIAGYQRYTLRVTTYSYFLTAEYPSFNIPSGFDDPVDYAPVRLDVRPAIDGRSRATVFFRGLLAIPHMIVLEVLGIAMGVVTVLAYFAVTFTGRWPGGMQGFALGYLRWTARVGCYYSLVVDEYPPFSLD